MSVAILKACKPGCEDLCLGKASALAGDEYKKEMKCMMLDDEVKEKKEEFALPERRTFRTPIESMSAMNEEA